MMNRRALLRLVGLAALAPALPAAAVAAAPTPNLYPDIFSALFAGELTTDLYMEDGSEYSIPAMGSPHHDYGVILSFQAPQTGVIDRLYFRRGSLQLVGAGSGACGRAIALGDYVSMRVYIL